MKLNKNNLNEKWTKAKTAAELFIWTIEGMRSCNINNDLGTNSKTTVTEPKPATAKLYKKALAADRGKLPDDFPTFKKFYEKVKAMAEAGDSKDTVESKFKPANAYTASCWLCLI